MFFLGLFMLSFTNDFLVLMKKEINIANLVVGKILYKSSQICQQQEKSRLSIPTV